MATQEIYVLNKRLKLLHTEKGFKTSIDSVLLAAACKVKAGEHILDLGCGVGGAGLCVLSRVSNVHLTGVEIQEDHAQLARRNAEINLFQNYAEFIHADIRTYRNEKAFDHVICNPPYLDAGAHLRSPSKEKATAMGGLPPTSSCDLIAGSQEGGKDPSVKSKDDSVFLKDWVDCAHFCLKSNGTLTMIHRADKVDRIILAMGKRFGAIEIIPLWPKRGEQAKRVIVRAIKDRKSPATLHAGLILHQNHGEYTEAADKILKDMKAL